MLPQKADNQVEGVAQLVECLPKMPGAQSLVPKMHKPCVALHTYNLSTQKEDQGPEVYSDPWFSVCLTSLHSDVVPTVISDSVLIKHLKLSQA